MAKFLGSGWSGLKHNLHRMTTPSIQSPHTIGCYSHRLTNQKAFELLTQGDISQQRILDVGAGEGFFCSLLGDYLKKRYSISPSKVLTACDLYPENFRYLDVPCDRIDLRTSLPYPDDSFDSVSCIEVIEHIEDQFQFVPTPLPTPTQHSVPGASPRLPGPASAAG